MFEQLLKLDFKAQFVVARKKELAFRNNFHSREGELYDYLISLLFKNVLHRNSSNHVYISQRGTRLRQEKLEGAVTEGISKFEKQWNFKVPTLTKILPHTAVGEPCLQVIDYMNWAVYRAFVKREMRYYKFIQDKVSLLVDLYDKPKYPKNWYNRGNPFEVEKASPL